MQTQYEIAVIGSGNAAEGVVHGLLRKMILLDDRIIATDPNADRRAAFANRFNITTSADNRQAVSDSYLILLAVKPQVFKEVCAGFADVVRDDHVIVSIMAGVPTKQIEQVAAIHRRASRRLGGVATALLDQAAEELAFERG